MPVTYINIASQVLASSAASVTFSSIPNTYTDLLLKINNRTTGAGTNGAFTKIRWNNDSSAVYSLTHFYAQNVSTTGSTRLSNDTTFDTTRTGQPSSGNTANFFGAIEVYLPNYGVASHKPIFSESYSENNDASQWNIDLEAGLWRNNAAVSSIEIYNNGASFVAGSSFYLYGIKNS